MRRTPTSKFRASPSVKKGGIKLKDISVILGFMALMSAAMMSHELQSSSYPLVLLDELSLSASEQKSHSEPLPGVEKATDLVMEDDKRPDSKHEYQHQHVIPPIIYFTYKHNLLLPGLLTEGETFDEEEKVLADNTRNTINLHPNAEIHFLTDDECLTIIKRVMSASTLSNETETNTLAGLDNFFLQEKKGMLKSDVCRGAALYESGGLYFDVDLQARMNVWDVIPLDTEFVTPLVHKKHKVKGAFFQAFIGTIPRNPVIYRYLEMFAEYYRGSREISSTKSKGVVLLRQAYDDIKSKTEPFDFLHNVQLWQEVRYNKDAFPDVEPTRGKRRACHFLVEIPDRRRLVPFYSRVKGSRMCGGKDS